MLILGSAPWAAPLAADLPACPVKGITDLPCLGCGATRAALALTRFDLSGSLSANPLAAGALLMLVIGGLVVGGLAVAGVELREPSWRLPLAVRAGLVLGLMANWIYLILAGV